MEYLTNDTNKMLPPPALKRKCDSGVKKLQLECNLKNSHMTKKQSACKLEYVIILWSFYIDVKDVIQFIVTKTQKNKKIQ